MWLQLLPLCFQFKLDTDFQFILGKSNIYQICVCLQLFSTVYLTEDVQKVQAEFRHFELCVLKKDGLDNDWLLVFIFCFGEFKLVAWYVHLIQVFEQFTKICCMCFFAKVLRHGVSTDFHKLVVLVAIGVEFQCLFPYTGFLILVTLFSCDYYCPFKAVETLLWSVLDETVCFCSNKT